MFNKLKYSLPLVLGCCFNISAAFALPTTNSGQAYINECAAAGVPIPPDWGNSKWKSKGKISDPFISVGSDAYVYTYESSSPSGLCVALPRVSSTGKVGLLGIICQGKDTSKACFWDNSTFTLNSISDSKALSSFTGGAGLEGKSGGECTTCHAGGNIYISVPGWATDFGALGQPKSYVSPLVASGWEQNTTPSTVSGDCDSCHKNSMALPQLSTALTGYCSSVLQKVKDKKLMPPSGLTGSTFDTHFAALFNACDQPPPATPKPPSQPALSTELIWVSSMF